MMKQNNRENHEKNHRANVKAIVDSQSEKFLTYQRNVSFVDNDSPEWQALTEMQKAFVEGLFLHYFNYTRAARYCGKVTQTEIINLCNEMKTNPKIAAAIKAHKAYMKDRLGDPHAAMVSDLVNIINADITDFMDIVDVKDKDGNVIDQTLRFKPAALMHGNGKVIEQITIGRKGITLKLENRAAAREALAKHLGFYELDNMQRSSNMPQFYLPDNGRGDVQDAQMVPEEGERQGLQKIGNRGPIEDAHVINDDAPDETTDAPKYEGF